MLKEAADEFFRGDFPKASQRDVVINSPPIYRWVGAQNKALVPKGRLMSQDYISYESSDQIETRRDHSGRTCEDNNQPCLRHFPSNWDSNPPVNWWAIPQMSLQDKRQHPKQTPKTRSKTTFKTNPVSRNFRLPKAEWRLWSPSVLRAIGLRLPNSITIPS